MKKNWGVKSSTELKVEFTNHVYRMEYEAVNRDGWSIREGIEPYDGPKVGCSDFVDDVHTYRFGGWVEGILSDGNFIFPRLSFPHDNVSCDVHNSLHHELASSDVHANGITDTADLTMLYGAYRCVGVDVGENGAHIQLTPFVFDDRTMQDMSDNMYTRETSEQLAINMNGHAPAKEEFRKWCHSRSYLYAFMAAPPFSLYMQDTTLANTLEQKEWGETIVMIPQPMHTTLKDDKTGDLSRVLDSTPIQSGAWGLIDYDTQKVNTILGNISNEIASFYENGRVASAAIENAFGENAKRWRPVWRDKRKTKRIGMTVGYGYWHGYSRCGECNGEIEYAFNKRVETATYKCPHCMTENSVKIPELEEHLA